MDEVNFNSILKLIHYSCTCKKSVNYWWNLSLAWIMFERKIHIIWLFLIHIFIIYRWLLMRDLHSAKAFYFQKVPPSYKIHYLISDFSFPYFESIHIPRLISCFWGHLLSHRFPVWLCYVLYLLFFTAPARLPAFHTCVGANEERLTPKWYKEHGINHWTQIIFWCFLI